MNKIGLYIHIPFCNQICPYCDFYKMKVSTTFHENYISALTNEIKLRHLENYEFKTIYIGGGTPSSLSLELLEKLFLSLLEVIDLSKLEEFSIEANPEDINKDFVKLLKKYNISRISIGIQSLNKKFQDVLKRPLEYSRLKQICDLLHKYDLNNYSFDLIYGMKCQSIADVEEDLNLYISLKPMHISTYSLMIEEHSIFGYLSKNGQNLSVNDDLEADMYEKIIEILENNEYFQYETSNFSKLGYESRHNLIYWNDESFLALGAGSTYFYDNIRYTIKPDIKSYINHLNNNMLPEAYLEQYSKVQLMDEYLMLSLRKTIGISKIAFKQKFGVSLDETYPKIKDCLKTNLLIETTDGYMIPKKYRYVANMVIVKIMN